MMIEIFQDLQISDEPEKFRQVEKVGFKAKRLRGGEHVPKMDGILRMVDGGPGYRVTVRTPILYDVSLSARSKRSG